MSGIVFMYFSRSNVEDTNLSHSIAFYRNFLCNFLGRYRYKARFLFTLEVRRKGHSAEQTFKDTPVLEVDGNVRFS